MNTGKISGRYAKALFELSIEENKADKINQDIKLLFETCDIEDFKTILENPVILPSQKTAFFKSLFKNKIDTVTLDFLILLAKNKRELHLKNIARSFLHIYRKHFHIKSVELTTSTQLDKKYQDTFKKIISENFNTKVELTEVVDTKIIGGFVLKIEDQQYDASIASKLTKVKRELLNTSVN